MVERDPVSLNAYVTDAELRRFARDQARRFFAGNVSGYIVTLIELDRDQGITRDEISRRLAESAIDDRDLTAVPA